MKKIIAAAALAITATAAHAEQRTVEQCMELSELASGIMTFRQMGRPMSEVINMFSELEGFQSLIPLITHAYDSPLYSTQRHKDREVSEFGSRYLSSCLKS